MSDEQQAGENKSADVVSREDYNKIVESHNSIKLEKEKLTQELERLNKTKEESEKESWITEQKKIREELDEIKKKAEEKVKISKGIISDKPPEKNVPLYSDVKSKLDGVLPDRVKNPEQFGSNIHRYGWYKNPTTKAFTHEQLGMGMSLHAGALRVSPDLIPPEARRGRDDIVVNK